MSSLARRPGADRVMIVRQELAIPPRISVRQAKGFTLVLEVAKTNLRELALD